MTNQFVTQSTIDRRAHWLAEIVQISGHFGNDFARMEKGLTDQIAADGVTALFDHLRLAGAIPEKYDHDSSEEKLYSKYTDALLSASFNHIGLNSIVLTERADAADVEAATQNFSLVADAKAFRLSRTAKNQKDFKVDAMHRWKRGKPFAMVVCPIYQLPIRSSQIYLQAISQSVCVFTYSHLAVLVQLAQVTSQSVAQDVLHQILRATEALHPSKDASPYWQQINTTMLNANAHISDIWRDEKIANRESILAAREEGLAALANERTRILSMSHAEAIQALIKDKNIEGRIRVINSVSDHGILELS